MTRVFCGNTDVWVLWERTNTDVRSPEWACTTSGSVAASCVSSLALARTARTPALAFSPRHFSVSPAWRLPRSNPSLPNAPANDTAHCCIPCFQDWVVDLIIVLLHRAHHLHPLDSSDSSSSIIGSIHSGPLFLRQSLFIVGLLKNIFDMHIQLTDK